MVNRMDKIVIRRAIMPAAVLLAALTCGTPVIGQQAPAKEEKPASQQKSAPPPAKEKPSPAKPEKVAPPSLEEMLTQALKQNPDIRVAETKLREAEADLNRIRLQVTRQVVAHRQAMKTQQSLIESAEATFKAAEAALKLRSEQYKQARTTQFEVQTAAADLELARTKLITTKAKLAEIEAELPYLLGNYPQTSSADSKADQARLLYLQTIYQAQKQLNEWANSEALKGRQAASQPPPDAMADKIRKALNTPIQFEFDNVPLSEVVTYLGDRTGVSFHIKGVDLANQDVALRLKEAVPLAAALQAIGDLLPKARFVVRDYGILVADPATLPPGAILVENFWKTPPTQAASTRKGLPSGDEKWVTYEGLIQDVDDKSGLVTIALGSDAGLRMGDTLEVYRVVPKPTFVGSVRVVDVKRMQAVAKPVTPLKAGPIQKGDRYRIDIRR